MSSKLRVSETDPDAISGRARRAASWEDGDRSVTEVGGTDG